MRTLLKLYFVPYLQYFLKFNLLALAGFVLVFLVRLDEARAFALPLYLFGLYATSNRHLFKENISWKLSTFNRGTLIRYHLLSQSLLVGLQFLGATLMSVLFVYLNLRFAPRENALSGAASSINAPPGGEADIVSKIVALVREGLGTRDQMVLQLAFLVFLLVMYSPVSVKDALRKQEGQTPAEKRRLVVAVVVAYGLVAVLFLLRFDFERFMLVLLALIAAATLFVGVRAYNRVFVLFNPRYYLGVAALCLLVGAHFGFGHYRQALGQFRDPQLALSKRLGELSFLGAFAPALGEAEARGLVASVRDARDLRRVLETPALARHLDVAFVERWLVRTDDFALATELLALRPLSELALLRSKDTWAHLDKVFAGHYQRSPGDARVRVERLASQVAREGLGLRSTELAELTGLEQYLLLGEWRAKDQQRFKAVALNALHPVAYELHFERGQRAPAALPTLPAPAEAPAAARGPR